MARLENLVAVVTGASRGGGRGIAVALGDAGATVYVSGRSVRGRSTTGDRPETIDETAAMVDERGGRGIPVRCDHSVDEEVETLFRRVEDEEGGLDLLVNNAWGGYEMTVDRSPFWEIPLRHWDLMFDVGVRSHVVAAGFAVPLLEGRNRPLVVNTTAPVGDSYHGHVFYDVAKSSVIRMSRGMAADLREKGVAVVAVAPGWMRTERVLDAMGVDAESWQEVPELERTESPEYLGRAVAALAADPDVIGRSGGFFEVGELAREYGFTDVDGRRPSPFTELFADLLADEEP